MGKGLQRRERAGASRRFLPLAGCTAAVAALGLLMAWGGRSIADRSADAAARGVQDRAAPASPDGAAGEAAAPARTVDERNSESVPRGRATGWQRLPPRAPLGPSAFAAPKPPAAPAAPPPPDPGLPQRVLLFNPVIPAAGRIEAAGHVVELEGMRVVDPGRQCAGSGGRSWPCGMVSRAAFRAWVRSRAVECIVTPTPLPKPVLSLCRLGGKDMAEWLVTNGLAEAAPGSAYEEAGRRAQAAGRGIFGDRPRALAVSVAAPVAPPAGVGGGPVASTTDPDPLIRYDAPPAAGSQASGQEQP